MATTTATVTSEGISLPADFMAEVELEPGSRIKVSVASEPAKELVLVVDNKPRKTPAEIEQAVKKFRSRFAGGPSLEDEYFRNKEKDKW